MALTETDSYPPHSCSEAVKASGTLPPFHIESLLSIPASPAPARAAVAGKKSGGTATIHHKATPAAAAADNCDGGKISGGSAFEWAVACLSAAGHPCSCGFHRSQSLTPSFVYPPPPPTSSFAYRSPASCYFPPPAFHLHYQLPVDWGGSLPVATSENLSLSSPLMGLPSPPLTTLSSPPLAALPSPPLTTLPSPPLTTLPSPPLAALPSPPLTGLPSRYRTSYSRQQLHTLETVFSERKYVNYEERLAIARDIGVTEKQVKMWFQNRRTKMKKYASKSAVKTLKKNQQRY